MGEIRNTSEVQSICPAAGCLSELQTKMFDKALSQSSAGQGHCLLLVFKLSVSRWSHKATPVHSIQTQHLLAVRGREGGRLCIEDLIHMCGRPWKKIWLSVSESHREFISRWHVGTLEIKSSPEKEKESNRSAKNKKERTYSDDAKKGQDTIKSYNREMYVRAISCLWNLWDIERNMFLQIFFLSLSYDSYLICDDAAAVRSKGSQTSHLCEDEHTVFPVVISQSGKTKPRREQQRRQRWKEAWGRVWFMEKLIFIYIN